MSNNAHKKLPINFVLEKEGWSFTRAWVFTRAVTVLQRKLISVQRNTKTTGCVFNLFKNSVHIHDVYMLLKRTQIVLDFMYAQYERQRYTATEDTHHVLGTLRPGKKYNIPYSLV